jgi:hypothetical protein
MHHIDRSRQYIISYHIPVVGLNVLTSSQEEYSFSPQTRSNIDYKYYRFQLFYVYKRLHIQIDYK